MLTRTFLPKPLQAERNASSKTWRPVPDIALGVVPLIALALPGTMASTEQVLWLSSAFYAAMAVAGPRAGTAIKACEVLAASCLCALALVWTGV